MNFSFKQRLDAMEATVGAITFRAHLRKARRAPTFADALLDATRVDADGYLLDMAGLDEHELLELAGGAEFAQWWDGLDLHAQIDFARGERPPWRATP
jgi:hypothetical protein